MCFPAISSSRVNCSVVASRLESLLQVKFIRSYKNIFQNMILDQKEFIVELILETISQGRGNMDVASEEKRSSSLVLAVVQPISLTKNSTARNDWSYKRGKLNCVMFGSKVLCFERLLKTFLDCISRTSGGNVDHIMLTILLSKCSFTCNYQNINEHS